MMWKRMLGMLLVAVFAVIGCGCSGQQSRTGLFPTYPVFGEVYFQGTPAAQVRVMLSKVGEPKGVEAEAVTQQDGKFAISNGTSLGGVREGTFDVWIAWPETLSSEPEDEVDRLKGRYNNAKAAAFQITVKPGNNVVARFDLQ